MAELESILRQIEKPILYAATNRFQNLSVIHDLGRFVLAQIASLDSDLSPAQTLDLNDLRALFVDFDRGPLDRRKTRLNMAIDLIGRIRGREPEETSSVPWSTPIQYVKGIGPKRAQTFDRLGIKTLEDLLLFVPWRYEDRSVFSQMNRLRIGELQTIEGRVVAADIVPTRRRGFTIFEAAISDGTGVVLGKWFNQAFLKKSLVRDRRVLLSGTVVSNPRAPGGFEMVNPQYELPGEGEEETLHAGRIVPIYHESRGITSRHIRRIVKRVLEEHSGRFGDVLSGAIREARSLVSFEEALSGIHFPPAGSDVEGLNKGLSPYHRRLAFDEFFLLELGLSLKKRGHADRSGGIRMPSSEHLLSEFRRSLPFRMTEGQERAVSDVLRDIADDRPMHRLIQGDVGCGKTTVALAAMYVAAKNGAQSAMMAPTEILAAQHFVTLKDRALPLGLKVALVTGGRKTKPRAAVLGQIASEEVDIVVGTHALLSEDVSFHRLGLTVVDEQHKFGVAQRLAISHKGASPHVLIMTATPIPRTLALTVYGDLDMTVIRDLPAGRPPVETRVGAESRRSVVYAALEKAMAEGRQGYVVYPIVEESEQLDLKAATRMAEHLQKEIFPHRRLALLHGKMKTEQNEAVMLALKEGRLDLLVTTSIIEVGIDVPNAAIMVIEHAERFGLAQLHQLRGRIGRGTYPSLCVLMMGRRVTAEGKRRLDALVKSRDGFALAEEDLAIRGPGEFFGTRQSGLPELRVANILRDAALLEVARADAQAVIGADPTLERPENRPLREVLHRKWEDRLRWASAG